MLEKNCQSHKNKINITFKVKRDMLIYTHFILTDLVKIKKL